MPLSPSQLTEIGDRFIDSMNARDYASATSLYSVHATYESATLVESGHSAGRIDGREQIMSYFKEALDGDESFRLSRLDLFTGLNLVLILSSMADRTFVDVLRVGDDGLITEHLELSPKQSPIDFLTKDAK